MEAIILKVQGCDIALINSDYISLTDMCKAAADSTRAAATIQKWLRNRSTIDFLGIWETIYNPIFKVPEFEYFKSMSGNSSFTLSVESWVEKTGAIGIYSKKGKYGGTYAHKDIAFEFGAAISPSFKLYLLQEYQRLTTAENASRNVEWDMKRLLSKAQYQIQTDAVKDYKIPANNIPENRQWLAYAEEGDILNVAMFGCTAKQWRDANPSLPKNVNIRDCASAKELAVLCTLEAMNAEMIKDNVSYVYRLEKLIDIRKRHLASLEKIDLQKSYNRTFKKQLN